MFEVGQKVVYPMHGIATIERIEEREVLGKKQVYYFLKLEYSGMTVMIPVEHCEKARLRKVVSEDEVSEVVTTLENPCENITIDWKKRYSQNHEKLKNGSILALTEVVRDLFYRNLIKELSRGEKKLYDSAIQLLCDELSCAQQKEATEVRSTILGRLKAQASV